MADDNSVVINFRASTDGVISGVAQLRGTLNALREQIGDLDGSMSGLAASFAAAMPIGQINQAAKGIDSIAAATQDLASQTSSASAQMRIMQIGAAEERAFLNAEVSQLKITQDQKFALLEAESEREYQAELEALNRKLLLSETSARQQERIHDQMEVLTAKHNADELRLDEQSIAAQQAQWTGYLSTVTGAFNSQLRGLLEGTTSWHKASVKMLEDLTIKFIESAEQVVVKWLASEIAQTTATQTGAAARVAANETAADSGILAGAATAVRAIMTDAAQAFAGVFAFLAPTMGPAAAGPAAAAQGTVMAVVSGFDVGTDYVVRGGLALIHPGETIIPAARGSGPFTGAGNEAMARMFGSMLDSHRDAMTGLMSEHRRTTRGLWSAVDSLHDAVRRLR